MAKQRLTEKGIERLRPPATGRADYWDTALPSFGLRLSHTGRKVFVVMYRLHGDPRKLCLTLGTFPALKLAEARDKARKALQEVAEGGDPGAAKQARKRGEDAVETIISEYAERHLSTLRTGKQVVQALDNEVVPSWGKRSIHDIRRRDVIELLDRVQDRAPIRANRVRAYLSSFFRWAMDRDIIDANPAAGVRAPAKEKPRDRVLTDDEIRRLWPVWEAMSYPFGTMAQLLLVTAQRRGEVAGMRWDAIDKGTWTLAETKASRAQVVPLSKMAQGILESIPVVSEEFVFSTRQGRPVAGFSKAKAEMDALSGVTGWTLHDLRRTAATGMAKSGVDVHLIERCLNHATRSVGPIAAVYNIHGYEKEKRHALEKWAARLKSTIEDKPVDNVVVLRK